MPGDTDKPTSPQIETAWTGAWRSVRSLQKPYRGYGIGNFVWVLRRMLAGEGRRAVLDVGCGIGRYFPFLRDLGFQLLCGLEYDATNVAQAQALNAHLENVEIVQGDIRALPEPFGEAQFDAVISLGLVEHFAYPVPNIRRMLSCLKPGGALILEMPNFSNCLYYQRMKKRGSSAPFHLWWGLRHWERVLSRVDGSRLEQVQAARLWAHRDYLARLLGRISPKLVNVEIDLENRLLPCWGRAGFYKLRRLDREVPLRCGGSSEPDETPAC
jgi:SAM-dependent methyltransferase